MVVSLLCEIQEEYLYAKIDELKNLKKIKTNDLATDYLIFFSLCVNKIVEKNDEYKTLTHIEKEKKTKELIANNIENIKKKLKEKKKENEGTNLKREDINYQKTLYTQNEQKNDIPITLNKYEKSNLGKICNDLTCILYFCISLLIQNLRIYTKYKKTKIYDTYNLIIQKDNNEEKKNIINYVESNNEKNEKKVLSDIVINFFELNLLYISFCFYNIYLLNNNDIYYLYVSLILFLKIFYHFKNKKITHKICINNKKIYIKYDLCVENLLFKICDKIGVIQRKQKNIYESLFFLTYSFIFYKHLNKSNINNFEKNEECNTIDMEIINVVQNINDIFLQLNFFTASTFFVLKIIDMHLSCLRNEIKNILIEQSVIYENKDEKILQTINNKNDESYYLDSEENENINFYILNGNVILNKKRNESISFDEKLKKIIDMCISIFNNIVECSYIFLDLHLLSIYEHLINVSFCMIKDVYKLFHILKKEKEKNIIVEYKYMIYRNFLEMYIIYLKYNYLNYSQTCTSIDIYKHVNYIHKKKDKIKNYIFSLLKTYATNNTKEINNLEFQDNTHEKKTNTQNITKNVDIKKITTKAYFDNNNNILIYDSIQKIEKNIICLENVIHINAEEITKGMQSCLFSEKQFPKRNKYDFDIISFIITDENIIYKFICEQILKKNNLNFEKDENKYDDFEFSDLYEKMSFSKTFCENVKKIDETTEEIFHLIKNEQIRRNEKKYFDDKNKSSIIPSTFINIDTNYVEEFLNIFQFNKIKLNNLKLDVCNFCNSKYNNLAINKMKNNYKKFTKHRNDRKYENFLSLSFLQNKNIDGKKKQKDWIDYSEDIHYLCYNHKEIEFLFKKIKKYIKKCFEYYSLFNQTTLHLDILINSSEAYFYYNFFTKSFDECIKNYMDILYSFSYPLKYIEHKQYLFYKRDLALKCALLLKDVYICKKWNIIIDNIYFNSDNKDNKNLNFDDNISGNLTKDQKQIILQVIQYYYFFLKTYEIEKETTNEIIFENDDEKKSYFDIYFYVCKTLSTVDDKNFITQAINNYQYLLNYSLKNKMYHDEQYNEYMKNFCKKSIYMLGIKLNEIA
ncbi:conserved Plasmodium protein, unknown function [Plasmodium berghei]|uniref:KIF-binding protein n=2 Tax=Plasmodium berghei TaxID=5821 RepID=A0A509AXJ2_PLABA|nr:conserved Plasmodium protein, unknown function [Plasmodium berghei ANKA]CXI99283.1 conserved Plasmodium protein, unknown function [Plasmodium berghei]SCL97848.1 conserved Plasmodium protein, unknown function [Plasmodium berghei]SCM16694.1 conserved Plasmodium protein, unknown function [Plasmodium berghei]SCM18492.1 conserved Plasmodium protein, unknown function [Plasmodium berghei]SCN27925.1 conserved Plasmodium protein, unknown function [Plasmodium berghei]|eukprot:XP_034423577.1 conserved Plasmodium protein, unknown function [Plasmodium berghei ANKA]